MNNKKFFLFLTLGLLTQFLITDLIAIRGGGGRGGGGFRGGAGIGGRSFAGGRVGGFRAGGVGRIDGFRGGRIAAGRFDGAAGVRRFDGAGAIRRPIAPVAPPRIGAGRIGRIDGMRRIPGAPPRIGARRIPGAPPFRRDFAGRGDFRRFDGRGWRYRHGYWPNWWWRNSWPRVNRFNSWWVYPWWLPATYNTYYSPFYADYPVVYKSYVVQPETTNIDTTASTDYYASMEQEINNLKEVIATLSQAVEEQGKFISILEEKLKDRTEPNEQEGVRYVE